MLPSPLTKTAEDSAPGWEDRTEPRAKSVAGGLRRLPLASRIEFETGPGSFPLPWTSSCLCSPSVLFFKRVQD